MVTEYFTYTPIEWKGYTPYNQALRPWSNRLRLLRFENAASHAIY